MLKLKHKHHIDFPHIVLSLAHPMRLSPVIADEDDELSESIANDPISHDNNWQLEEHPDGEQLTHFWEEIVSENAKDSEQIDFAER